MQWELLVEAYGTHRARHGLVAKIVGLPERTCRTAWTHGFRSLEFAGTPIRATVEQAERIQRRAFLAEQLAADTPAGESSPAAQAGVNARLTNEFVITGEVTEADVERVRRRLLQNRMLDADALHGATQTTRDLWEDVGTLKAPLRKLVARIGSAIDEMAAAPVFDLKEALLILKFLGEYKAKLASVTKALGEAQAAALADARLSIDTGELRQKEPEKSTENMTAEDLIAQMNVMALDIPRQLARIHQKLAVGGGVGVPGTAPSGAKPPAAE